MARNLTPGALGGTNYFLSVYGTDFDDKLSFIPFVSKGGLGFYTIADWWGKMKMEESATLEAFSSFEPKKYHLLWEVRTFDLVDDHRGNSNNMSLH